jgi:hypothetical protein
MVPLLCLALALAMQRSGRLGAGIVAVLVSSGLLMHWQGLSDPLIFGAGRQADGVRRDEVRRVLGELREAKVRYVYSTEPMLHWVLLFESGGEVVARGRNPLDRVAAYAEQVDSAWRRGEPVAVVNRRDLHQYEVIVNPPEAWLRRYFRFAPAVSHRMRDAAPRRRSLRRRATRRSSGGVRPRDRFDVTQRRTRAADRPLLAFAATGHGLRTEQGSEGVHAHGPVDALGG